MDCDGLLAITKSVQSQRGASVAPPGIAAPKGMIGTTVDRLLPAATDGAAMPGAPRP